MKVTIIFMNGDKVTTDFGRPKGIEPNEPPSIEDAKAVLNRKEVIHEKTI